MRKQPNVFNKGTEAIRSNKGTEAIKSESTVRFTRWDGDKGTEIIRTRATVRFALGIAPVVSGLPQSVWLRGKPGWPSSQLSDVAGCRPEPPRGLSG